MPSNADRIFVDRHYTYIVDGHFDI